MKKVKLGDVCKIQSGGTPSRGNLNYWNNGNIPWVKISDIKEKYLSRTEEFITQEGLANSSAKIFPKETILYTIFATLGEVSILEIEATTNQAIAGLQIIDENICKDYLYYYLISLKPFVNEIGRGVAQNNINMQILRNFEIPLPSLEEQKAIARKLDKVSGLIEKRKTQLEKLSELVKSRFIEMFGDPNSNPMHWNKVELAECLINIENGKSFVCDSEPRIGEKPAVLKLSAATYGYYQPHENKAMLDDTLFVESAEVHKGDLLFTRKNTPELVGMCAYVYDTPSKLMMPDLIFRLNTRANCDKVFLWKIINLDLFRSNITALSSGSAKSMSNISKERLLGLEIILPPIALQQQFAAFVEHTDKSKFEIQQSLEKLEILKKSLMQQYFG